jgi:AcrR family transcriptional regulator
MADRRPADPGHALEPGDAGPASDADSSATGPHNSGGSPPSRTSARSAEGPPAGAARRRPRNVPLATIATEARVGVGTLYRSYADREALLRALEHRAYALLNQILDDIDHHDLPGLESVREFLLRTLAIGDQLILPLHGAPPLISAQAVAARQEINRRLDRFIERGRSDGSIRAAVNATDIIVFSATITQPLPHGPDWPLIAGRQLAIFVNGLAVSGPTDIPGPAVTRQDIEATFTLGAPPAEGK